MSLPRPVGPLEVWVGVLTALLCAAAVLAAMGGASGGYTGAVQSFMRMQLILVAMQTLSLFGLIGIMSHQHRTLRRSGRSAAMVASRRASDQVQGQIVTAAANLAAAAGAVNALIDHQRQIAAALGLLAEQSGVEVVRPVPPPGEDAR